MNRLWHLLLFLALCGAMLPCGPAAAPPPVVSSAHPLSDAENPLDAIARDTWAYLRSDAATANHLPYSWWSPTLAGGDYANPAEIGLYALSWLAAYDLGRPWSPSWAATEAEVTAVLDQLRAWQTGSQTYQPHGPNAYANSVFYQWYWISWNPPVVGANAGDNHLVPSVDNAWLAAGLITIHEYAQANGCTAAAVVGSGIADAAPLIVLVEKGGLGDDGGPVIRAEEGVHADAHAGRRSIRRVGVVGEVGVGRHGAGDVKGQFKLFVAPDGVCAGKDVTDLKRGRLRLCRIQERRHAHSGNEEDEKEKSLLVHRDLQHSTRLSTGRRPLCCDRPAGQVAHRRAESLCCRLPMDGLKARPAPGCPGQASQALFPFGWRKGKGRSPMAQIEMAAAHSCARRPK
ncbi:MAG TPA: hypothetical protein PKV82_14060 [Anaerolineae bacterium]|nr:hypothetical protein [Anaerolineae bacterium]